MSVIISKDNGIILTNTRFVNDVVKMGNGKHAEVINQTQVAAKQKQYQASAEQLQEAAEDKNKEEAPAPEAKPAPKKRAAPRKKPETKPDEL